MAEADLPEFLGRLRVLPVDPALFARTDTEASVAKVRHLAAAATYLNAAAVQTFGGRLGPMRERGLVEQVVGAAFQTSAGADPHPGPFDKAAMLLRGITQGHPFNGGNKRTGFLLATYDLDLVGYPIPEHFDFDRAEGLCVSVSAGEIRDVAAIAEELARLWTESATEPEGN
jgi:prophage maintenance system killer protein